MLAAALVLIVVAILLVRAGWEARRPLALFGWVLAAAGLVLLAQRDGAWGLAIGTVTGMATAFVILAQAGWTSPARERRPLREAPAIALPHRWPDLARRVAVFVLVVPAAFVAAQWLAFAVQALARAGGMADADTIVLTLFLQPVLWCALMCWQMTQSGPLRMLVPPIVATLLGGVLWGAA